MYPVVFHLGPFPVRSYGIALAISFLLGCGLALRRARAGRYSEDLMFGLFFWIIAAAIVGARAHFVLAHPAAFANPVDAFRLWDGGLTLYGGLLAAVLASWLYLARHRTPFLAVADVCCSFAGAGGGDHPDRLLHQRLLLRTRRPRFLLCAPIRPIPTRRTCWVRVFRRWRHSSCCPRRSFLPRADSFWREGACREPAGCSVSTWWCKGSYRWAVDFTRYYEPIDRLDSLAPVITTKSQVIALGLVACGVWLLARRLRGAARVGAAG